MPAPCDLSAVEARRLIGNKKLSPVELLESCIQRIDQTNPAVNAMVAMDVDAARISATRAEQAVMQGEPLGLLHGLPLGIKDLEATAGLRTTWGSPIYKDHAPERDSDAVANLRDESGIILGKTNTPEFGAGSQTYNEVFGPTRNPYDRSKTCGGSSGGAAVALAAGMLAIADGSDMGGSLRNPASFCNVVGLRPSPGRVPNYPAPLPWSGLAVLGPMARTAADCALLLAALAGPDARAPIALQEPGERFAAPLERDFTGVRLAWSRTLGGLPVDRRVTEALDAQRDALGALGCHIEDVEPDFSGADFIFRVLRAHHFALQFREFDAARLSQLKDTLVWNIEQGRGQSAELVGLAEVRRGELYHRMREFMERYEFLLAPVSQVPPFPVDEPWVREIEGVAMETYIDWMRSCFYISIIGHPALSVPFGFTEAGLPVGLQIVGRHRDDFGVLQLAHAVESAVGAGRRRPPR
jgi:amidase